MADETKNQAQAAAEAPAKVAETVADTAEKVVKESATVQKRERAAAKRRAKRAETANKASARRTKTATRKARTTTKRGANTTRTAARKTAAATSQGMDQMTNNFFNGFDAVPAFAPFQSLFTNAGERGQEISQRTQRVAEELAELTRANLEAVVEASRVAAEGARSIGRDVVASNRDGVEQAADAIRSLAEAKSPTEYLQLQNEIARASFDRAVAETSKLTESLVKLAGEAFQPISNRASANAERFNSFVA